MLNDWEIYFRELTKISREYADYCSLSRSK